MNKGKKINTNIRPELFFTNYDYGESEVTNISPGSRLYNGKIDKFKSVKDFIEHKRKNRKKMKNSKIASDLILKVANKFNYLSAQEANIDVDMSVTDNIRSKYTPIIINEYNKILETKNVSSTEVRCYYNNGVVTFGVDATGPDANDVNQQFGTLLNKKYAPTVGKVIKQYIKNQPSTFNFQLCTLE